MSIELELNLPSDLADVVMGDEALRRAMVERAVVSAMSVLAVACGVTVEDVESLSESIR